MSDWCGKTIYFQLLGAIHSTEYDCGVHVRNIIDWDVICVCHQSSMTTLVHYVIHSNGTKCVLQTAMLEDDDGRQLQVFLLLITGQLCSFVSFFRETKRMSWAQLTQHRPPGPGNANGPAPFHHNQHRPPPRKQNNSRLRVTSTYDDNQHRPQPQIRPKPRQNHSNSIRPVAKIGPRVGMTTSKKKHKDILYVVLDSGAFIGRQSFFNHFGPDTTYFMTPAVNNEIRDKTSRHFLNQFPFEIVVRKPDPQSSSFGTTLPPKSIHNEYESLISSLCSFSNLHVVRPLFLNR